MYIVPEGDRRLADDKPITIQAVDRALDVLLLFAEGSGQAYEEGRGLGVTQIAERLDLAKSTVHRILSTLEARGFCRQDPVTGRYHLGLKALELAGAYLAQSDLGTAAYPEMCRLRDLVEETVTLYVRDGTDRVRVQKAEGRHGVRRVVGLGQRLPLHLGAASKVLLAWLPDYERERVLGVMRLPVGFDLAGLKAAVRETRQRGWASSAEEREEGVASVAAPILDRNSQCVAALAISGPVQRFTAESVERYAQAAQEAARNIGMRL